jgi:Tlde1 domain
MGRLFVTAGAGSIFVALAALLAVACVDWRLTAAGPRDMEMLAERLGDSAFAPARSYTLASLSPSAPEILPVDGSSERDIDVTGSLGSASDRASFEERFSAGFPYYRRHEEPSGDVASAPAARELRAERAPPSLPLSRPEDRTAIYDIAAHVVYLPDGQRLEAHSGLGRAMDEPRFFTMKNRGPTPPNVYDLALRKQRFHGVQAIRLIPADEGRMFGRDAILAHSYMLGRNGQSNGCVVFRNYPAFLNAYLRGEIDRLVVVDHLAAAPKPRLAAASESAANPLKQRAGRLSRSARRGDSSSYGI